MEQLCAQGWCSWSQLLGRCAERVAGGGGGGDSAPGDPLAAKRRDVATTAFLRPLSGHPPTFKVNGSQTRAIWWACSPGPAHGSCSAARDARRTAAASAESTILMKPKRMGQAAKNRVLGRALMMLVDNERSMKLITCCVVVKQPRRVVGRHLCGLEQR